MAGVVGLSELPVLGWRRKGLVKHLAALQAEDAALSAGVTKRAMIWANVGAVGLQAHVAQKR